MIGGLKALGGLASLARANIESSHVALASAVSPSVGSFVAVNCEQVILRAVPVPGHARSCCAGCTDRAIFGGVCVFGPSKR